MFCKTTTYHKYILNDIKLIQKNTQIKKKIKNKRK